MNLLNKYEIVSELLMKYPHLRDDSLKLLATVWKFELHQQEKDLYQLSAFDMLSLLADNNISNPESIRRVRAKIQEQRPSLRGEKWLKRHKYQDNIKTQLHKITTFTQQEKI